MDESRTDDISQVSEEENALLIAPMRRKKLKRRVFNWNMIRPHDRIVGCCKIQL
jgi:hypothetical protein